jgi:hypothetical protein
MAGTPYEHNMMPVAAEPTVTAVTQLAALPATGVAVVPWLAAAPALAGMLSGGRLLARRGLS